MDEDEKERLERVAEQWDTQITPEGVRYFYDPIAWLWRDEADTLSTLQHRDRAKMILGDWRDVRALNDYERSRGL
jgi:hypothetical protein